MTRDALLAWIARYESAWRSPGTEMLSDLFTPEASYSMRPYRQPAVGLDAIAELWERERVGADEVFTMEYDVVAIEGPTGVVRLHVRYGDPVDREYRDLWVVRLDDSGRCSQFEEWPFEPE